MSNLEGEMVDEMMQAALNIDVEAEIENRIRMATQLIETGRVDESVSKSGSFVPPGASSRSALKKGVRFQQDYDAYQHYAEKRKS